MDEVAELRLQVMELQEKVTSLSEMRTLVLHLRQEMQHFVTGYRHALTMGVSSAEDFLKTPYDKSALTTRQQKVRLP